MKILIFFSIFISSALSSKLLLTPQVPSLSVSEAYNDSHLKTTLFNGGCDFASGTLVDMRIENCTDTTACNIITKREHYLEIDFKLSASSSNLIWRVTGIINGEEETLVEEQIVGNVEPGLVYTLYYYLAFGTDGEGLSFPATFQIIDAPSKRTEICSTSLLDISSWHMVLEILSRIKAPIFPNQDFLITNYGAVAGGEIDNTAAIRNAIEACNAAGGGRVVVPSGTFLSGAITLLSNVNLYLAEGSIILFSQDTTKYPNVFSRNGGLELIHFSPFIYAFEAENIALTGTGILDGNADCEHWWPWKGRNSNLELLCGIIEGFPTESQDWNVLVDMAERNVPVEERVFGEGHYLRPKFVQPYRSKNVLIEDITLVRSPNWVLNPVLCENVIVRGVNINSTGPNSDGCNPESCKDVLIENVKFHTGDDCIAVKSGRNADGRRLNVKSENIVIQNCEFEDGHGGFTIGSEISGGVQNVFCQNCQMNSPQLEQGLRFKNNAVRGALIEDIFIRNIKISELYTGTSSSRGMALSIDFYYEEGPAGNYTPVVRNIDIRNVSVTKANYALFLRGFPSDHIEDVRLYDCHLSEVINPNVIENVDRLGLFNVTLNGETLISPESEQTTTQTTTGESTTNQITSTESTTIFSTTEASEPSAGFILAQQMDSLFMFIVTVTVIGINLKL